SKLIYYDTQLNLLFKQNANFEFKFTSTTVIYALSLHDALPISARWRWRIPSRAAPRKAEANLGDQSRNAPGAPTGPHQSIDVDRSEEHTSELQSRFDLVCRLLLEKKNRLRRDAVQPDIEAERTK